MNWLKHSLQVSASAKLAGCIDQVVRKLWPTNAHDCWTKTKSCSKVYCLVHQQINTSLFKAHLTQRCRSTRLFQSGTYTCLELNMINFIWYACWHIHTNKALNQQALDNKDILTFFLCASNTCCFTVSSRSSACRAVSVAFSFCSIWLTSSCSLQNLAP